MSGVCRGQKRAPDPLELIELLGDTGSASVQLTDSYKLPCGVWEPNLGPPKEQLVLEAEPRLLIFLPLPPMPLSFLIQVERC